MDAKTIATQIRTAVRRATKTTGDPLHGLTVSVRQMTGSMVTGVAIAARGLDEDEYLVPRDERDDHLGAWTDRGRGIVNRLNELAAPAFAESDGRHSFTDVTVGGTSAPLPGHFDDLDRARAAAHIEAQADAAVPADDEVTDPELCPSCLEVLGACSCAPAATCAHCGESIEPDDENGHVHSEDGVLGCGTPDAEARELYGSPAPACPNGHGPMPGRADIAVGGENLGAWHTCVTAGCGASYIAPSAELIGYLASGPGVHVTTHAAAVGHDVAPARYGARRDHLAAVR